MTRETEKKLVSWTIFVWVIGVIFAVQGYLFTQITIIQSDNQKATITSTQIQVQLSQIQTDLSWIKSKYK